jgi:hypothetical protein
MVNNRTSLRLLLYIFRVWHNLPYSSNKAAALHALLRPWVLTVQCLQNSTVAAKCSTQHGPVILVTKTDGQTRFIFPKEGHAEYWTADKRGAFTECCRRNILSGGVCMATLRLQRTLGGWLH